MEDAQVRGGTYPTDRIDDGMRRWYEACPCCMSQAYPDVKQALDEERARGGHTHADRAR